MNKKVQRIENEENTLHNYLQSLGKKKIANISLNEINDVLMQSKKVANNIVENFEAEDELNKCLEYAYKKCNILITTLEQIIQEAKENNYDFKENNYDFENLQNVLNYFLGLKTNVEKNFVDIRTCLNMSKKIDINLKKYRDELSSLIEIKRNRVAQMSTDMEQLLRKFQTIKQKINDVEEPHFMVEEGKRQKFYEKMNKKVQRIENEENTLHNYLQSLGKKKIANISLNEINDVLMQSKKVANNIVENFEAEDELNKCLEYAYKKCNILITTLEQIIQEAKENNYDFKENNYDFENLQNVLNYFLGLKTNVEKNFVDIRTCLNMSKKVDINLKIYRDELSSLIEIKRNRLVEMLTDMIKIIPLVPENNNSDAMNDYLKLLKVYEEKNKSDNEFENVLKLKKAKSDYNNLKKVHHNLKLTLESKQTEAAKLFDKKKTEVLNIKGTKIGDKVEELASICNKKKEKITNQFKEESRSKWPFESTQKELDIITIKQTKLEHADKKALEQVASQIVSGPFDKNIDITAGLRNFQRLSFVLSEIEYQIRKHFLPYLTSAIIRYQRFHNGNVSLAENDDDLVKKFLNSNNKYVKSISSLNHLDVENELQIQSITAMSRNLEFHLSGDLNRNLLNPLLDLIEKSANIRNTLSHHILIQNDVYQKLSNHINASIRTFTEAANTSKQLLELAESISPEALNRMYESDKKFPEREIHRLSGIQFKLPIENRKRLKLSANNSGLNSELTLEDWCKKLSELSKHERRNEENFSTVMEFFENFPNLKQVYYDAYNEQHEQQ